MQNPTLDSIVGNLIWLAVVIVTASIIFCFVINPVKADEAIFDDDQDYGTFYDGAYYDAHYEELLFGSFIPMVRSWSADWNERIVYVEVDSALLTGTDTACQLFGFMMKHITALDVIVLVTNEGWIPSTKNPIDHAWATHLAYDGYVPYIPAE